MASQEDQDDENKRKAKGETLRRWLVTVAKIIPPFVMLAELFGWGR